MTAKRRFRYIDGSYYTVMTLIGRFKPGQESTVLIGPYVTLDAAWKKVFST